MPMLCLRVVVTVVAVTHTPSTFAGVARLRQPVSSRTRILAPAKLFTLDTVNNMLS